MRNHLASRKLKWRTPQEKLSGNTPDISGFRFHFWEEVEYFDSNKKQLHDGWKPGRFLGIAWDSGDAMTYIVEPTLNSRGRPTTLTRSTLRRKPSDQFPLSINSGETFPEDEDEDNSYQLPETETTETDAQSENDGELSDKNEIELNEQIQSISDGIEEVYEFHHINSHTFNDGILIFNVELSSGRNFDVPFNLLKRTDQLKALIT